MAKKTSYLGNIKKELSDRSKASSKFSKANYEARYGVMGVKQPGSQARASSASKGLTNATGQLFGAVLQGRRYDSNGNQIKSNTASVKQVAKKAGKLSAKANLDAKGNAQQLKPLPKTKPSKPRTAVPMPKIKKNSPNASRTRSTGTPLPKKVSPNAGRSSYRGGPLRQKKGM